MIINYITHYIPDIEISNEYFFVNYGITNEEIISKSGIKQNDTIVISVFGGGYSSGAVLLKKL